VALRVLLLNAGIIARDGLPMGQLPPLGVFKPPPMLAGKPETDLSWLYAWWTVCDGSYYFYYFRPNGWVSYIETNPNPSRPAPKNPHNRGTYFFETTDRTIVDWTEVGSGSTPETFYDACPASRTMHVMSNRYSPLYAVKM
jgi:hypothetical protein